MMMFRTQQLIIESGLQNLYKVEQFVEELSDFYNINNTYFGNILISLTEAVKNAIVHGNKEDPNKKVSIIFETRPTGMFFHVSDEGDGFDMSIIPDPTEVQEEEGRKIKTGLYLIKSLSDNLIFKNKGSVIEFEFFISSINYQLSVDRSKALKGYFQPQDQKIRKNIE
ncbi:MAG: ATP-binding protein [Bacteroidales bacterium]